MFIDTSDPKYARIDERLRTELMVWLSTVRPDGKAHLVPVWFLWDGETFLIFSKPDQKVRNLAQNTSVMLGLDDTHGGEDPILFTGVAELLPHGAVTPALPAYAEKYSARFAKYKWTGESMGKVYSEPIRITPSKLLR
ncbi:MAG TPA: pyridoxamine 5'-phosphate oxidase family protein [Chloroflexia bacterium]|nr:pyridoxamine 5'-phosphate oxidase family protein [Chloroflexia bacterium]